MHRTESKERKNKNTINKYYRNTVYNTMSKKSPSDSAKEIFNRPPYYGCNLNTKTK